MSFCIISTWFIVNFLSLVGSNYDKTQATVYYLKDLKKQQTLLNKSFRIWHPHAFDYNILSDQTVPSPFLKIKSTKSFFTRFNSRPKQFLQNIQFTRSAHTRTFLTCPQNEINFSGCYLKCFCAQPT